MLTDTIRLLDARGPHGRGGVHVEALPEYFDPVLEAERRWWWRGLDTIGLNTRVLVESPGTIERSIGKARGGWRISGQGNRNARAITAGCSGRNPRPMMRR